MFAERQRVSELDEPRRAEQTFRFKGGSLAGGLGGRAPRRRCKRYPLWHARVGCGARLVRRLVRVSNASAPSRVTKWSGGHSGKRPPTEASASERSERGASEWLPLTEAKPEASPKPSHAKRQEERAKRAERKAQSWERGGKATPLKSYH